MTKGPLPLGLALVALCAPGVQALDPDRAPSQYVLTRWGARDLTSSSVHALVQTRDRYLWLGTAVGLVRFDGARFVVFNHRNAPGFGDGGVSSLAEGADGALYAGTTSGNVIRRRGGAFMRLPVASGTGLVYALHVARDGSLWVGAHGKPVRRWREGQELGAPEDTIRITPRTIVEDVRGDIWVGTLEDGVVRFTGGEFERRGLVRDPVQALCFDRSGALWIGTPHGLWRQHGATLRRFTRADGLSHDDVSALLQDRDGNLWVGTAGGGLNRFRDGRFVRFATAEGLTNDHVRSLLEDHEGNLWVGTADGLNCLSDGRFMTYGRLEGLKDPAVAAVAEGSGGSVWIGTNSGGLARLRDGAIEHFTLPGGVGSERVITLHECRDGSLWLALDNGRLFQLENNRVFDRTPPGSGKVRLILEDERGPIFFVAEVGLARIESGRVVPLPDEPPARGYLHSAYRDARGVLWLGTSGGLVQRSGNEYRIFTPREGLPRHRIRSIVGDEGGALWLAGSGGLTHLQDGRLRTVATEHGLPEAYLRLALDDGLGHLWIASAGHIFRVSKSKLLDVIAGRTSQVSPVVFDTSDGLRATDAILSNNPGFRGRDGRLWFATAQGVSVVDPRRISVDDPAPPVEIEGITVDGVRGERPEYDPGRGEVTIEYTALSFRSWSKLIFRHRLLGLHEDWVVGAERRRTAYYSNLPPGRYSFEVMASNHDGAWTGRAASLSFVINPPFHRTPLFYAACTAAVLGLVAAGHRLRVKQMHARLTATIDERTRIARELHDTLAQSLAGLGIQIDAALGILPGDATLDRVRRQLRQGLSMVRASLDEVRRSIWVLRAQTTKAARDLPSSLSQSLSQLTSDAGIRLTLQVTGEPRPLASDLERSLLRIAHEAVTNAVRHAGPETISIGLHFDDDHLRLQVRDDGCGFDLRQSPLAVRTDHFGLVGISERARSLGGDLRLTSRPGAGTEIDCRLPYRVHNVTPQGDDVEGVVS